MLPPARQINRSSSLRQPTRSSTNPKPSSRLPSHGKSASLVDDSARLGNFPSATASMCQNKPKLYSESTDTNFKGSNDKRQVDRSRTRTHRRSQSGTAHAPNPSEVAHATSATATAKPRFSTYQQHFTPKKSTKAPVQAYLHSDSEDKSARPSSPASPLEDELFLLSLLHSSSHTTQGQWEQSAKATLRKFFKDVSRKQKSLFDAGQLHMTNQNLTELSKWLDRGPLTMEQKLQALSQCVRDVSSLSRDNGLIEQVLKEFQTWYDNVTDILGAKASKSRERYNQFTMISPIDEQWADKARNALHKLEACEEQLENLGTADESTAIGKVLKAHKSLVSGLHAEVKVTIDIEKMVMGQEDHWRSVVISKWLRATDDEIVQDALADRQGIWNVA
ncbi:MAG: hypothetical protein Q9227_008977 [Pyrenula ochraceoflavens]